MTRVLIIGNARPENLTKWSETIEQSDLIIACDGALGNCIKHQIVVDYLIGDMDSVDQAMLDYARLNNIEIVKIPDQQNNDLSKAIQFARNLSAQSIDIIGIDGGRPEHQFANYMSLFEHSENIRMHLDDSIVIAINKNQPLHHSIEIGTSFSVFSIGESKAVNLAGGKWRLNSVDLDSSSTGLHNIAVETEITLSCASGKLLIFIDR